MKKLASHSPKVTLLVDYMLHINNELHYETFDSYQNELRSSGRALVVT